MKKRLAVAMVVILALAAGCSGVTKEQYESVVSENESAISANESLSTELKDLKQSNKVLESQYQEAMKSKDIISASYDNIIFEIPKSWKAKNYPDNYSLLNYITENNCILSITGIKLSDEQTGAIPDEKAKKLLEKVGDELIGPDSESATKKYITSKNGLLMLKMDFIAGYNKKKSTTREYLFIKANEMYVFAMTPLTGYDIDPGFEDVINSIK